MNNLLSQKWCLCLNVQNRIKLRRAKNHELGDKTTVCICVCVCSATYLCLEHFLWSQETGHHGTQRRTSEVLYTELVGLRWSGRLPAC